MRSYNGFTPAQRMAGERRINAAIFAGTIEPPEAIGCEVEGCGQTEGILQNHCEDYDNAVEDRTVMCWRCHMLLHSKHRAPEAVDAYFAGLKAGTIGPFPPVFRHDFGILARDHGVS